MTGYCPVGFSHSEIPGSKPACGSPRLIAADRVLHRLSAPRHPPYTLSSLTKPKPKICDDGFRKAEYPVFDINPLLRGIFSCQRAGRVARLKAADRIRRLQVRNCRVWWSWTGSNRRPPPCKGGALPTELQPLAPRRQARPNGGPR